MTNVYDLLSSLRPVDGNAYRVTGPGVHWEPINTVYQETDVHSDCPLALFPLPSKVREDLAALVVDRIMVIGYCGSGGKGARWVCRCARGTYVHQKTKFLCSENAKLRAMCNECIHLEDLKADASRR
jgi:hypothetical protein